MMLFKKISLLIAFFFTVIFSIAQQATGNSPDENYRMVHWGMNEGLSSDNYNIMLKDAEGFLWMGSANGLNRFDGNNFKHYFPGKNKPGAICGAYILNLVEDSLHHIWIGTNNGLARYDNKADTFRNFSPEVNAPLKLIEPFCATKDKLYCIEGGYTLTVYDIQSFQKRIIQKLYPDYSADDNDIAHSFFDAASNSIWMPEHFVPGKSVGGLFQISLSNGKTNRYTWECYKNIPGHVHDMKDICFDKKRSIIWVSSTDGLLEFTMNDKQFHRVEALNKVQDSDAFEVQSPEGVTLDAKGNVWWCSWPAGPVIFDPSSQTFYPVFSDARTQRKIGYTNLFIYCDRDGMVWTGCSEQDRGVYQIIPASIPVVHYAADTSQFSLKGAFNLQVVKGGDGKLWVAQSDDIYTFDPQTGYFHWISFGKYSPPFKTHLISFMQIDSVHQKALLDVWNSDKNEDTLYEMDIPSMQCHPVIFKDTLNKIVSPPKQFRIAAFKNDAVIISNISDDHLGVLTVSIDSCIARWTNVSFASFGGYATDNDHLIFIRQGRTEKNITYSFLNGGLTKVSSPLDSMKWSSVFYNKKDETLWVGFNDELRHYDKSFRIIKSYHISEVFFGDAIQEILPDEKGNIWMMFSRSVLWLNRKTGKITELSERDGFIRRPLGHSLIADNSVYVWGINGGLDRINLDKIKEDYPPSLAYFKSLQINETPFTSSVDINSLQALSLRYNQNRISIETGTIDYYAKGTGSIRYKLEGVNDEWQIAPANYVIRYEQLPPASYRLILQASNAAGEFNGPEKTLLITVSPAFWNTWWFRVVIIAIASYIIVTVVKRRIQKIHPDITPTNDISDVQEDSRHKT